MIQSTVSSLNFSNDVHFVINNIWRNKKILPRVQLFIWRLVSRNIASAKFCSRCGSIENDEHLFFHCDFSRAVWFLSPMGIKTDGLNGSCAQILKFMLENLFSSDQVDLSFCNLWFLCKARNDHRFNNKYWTVYSVISQAKGAQKAQYVAFDGEEKTFISNLNTTCNQQQEMFVSFFFHSCCRTDASFTQGAHARLGIYIGNKTDPLPWLL